MGKRINFKNDVSKIFINFTSLYISLFCTGTVPPVLFSKITIITISRCINLCTAGGMSDIHRALLFTCYDIRGIGSLERYHLQLTPTAMWNIGISIHIKRKSADLWENVLMGAKHNSSINPSPFLPAPARRRKITQELY